MPRALEALQAFAWPGNVRQLINSLERAKVMSDDHVIEYEDLPHEILDSSHKTITSPNNAEDKDCEKLADLQRSHVIEVLRREHGNKARASRVLGSHEEAYTD